MLFNPCGIQLVISKQPAVEPQSFGRVQWFCLVDQEGQKPGALISPTRAFCTLSMTESSAVMIVQPVKVWLVIIVQPDSSNVRLNTTLDSGRSDSETVYCSTWHCTMIPNSCLDFQKFLNIHIHVTRGSTFCTL